MTKEMMMKNMLKNVTLALALLVAGQAAHAEKIDQYDNMSALLEPQGTPSNQTLNIMGLKTTRANHLKEQNIYVGAKQTVVTRVNGQNVISYNWFFKSPAGWTHWTGGPIPVFMRTKVSGYGGVQPIVTFNILQNENVSAFTGTTDIYVGAGNDEADMLNNLSSQTMYMWTIGSRI